jgi:hypothetical protein
MKETDEVKSKRMIEEKKKSFSLFINPFYGEIFGDKKIMMTKNG